MGNKKQQKLENLLFGQRVRERREHLGLSRDDLSEFIDISKNFLVQIELGQKGVSGHTLRKLADALCTTADYLLNGRESLSDVSSVTAMLSTIDQPLIQGAEELLKAYMNSVNFIKSRVEKPGADGAGPDSGAEPNNP